MKRVAKPDAKFLLLVPNAGFLPRRLGLYGGTEQASVREEMLSLQQWQSLFDTRGLTGEHRWRDLHVLSLAWIFRGPLDSVALARGSSIGVTVVAVGLAIPGLPPVHDQELKRLRPWRFSSSPGTIRRGRVAWSICSPASAVV